MRGVCLLLALALGAQGKNLAPHQVRDRMQAHQFEKKPSAPVQTPHFDPEPAERVPGPRMTAEIVPGPVPHVPLLPRSKADVANAIKGPTPLRKPSVERPMLVAHGPVEMLDKAPPLAENAPTLMAEPAAVQPSVDSAAPPPRLKVLAALARDMFKPEPFKAGGRSLEVDTAAAAPKQMALPRPSKAMADGHIHHFGVSRDPAAPAEARGQPFHRMLKDRLLTRGGMGGAPAPRGEGGLVAPVPAPPRGEGELGAPYPAPPRGEGGMLGGMAGGHYHDGDSEEHHDHNPSLYNPHMGGDHRGQEDMEDSVFFGLLNDVDEGKVVRMVPDSEDEGEDEVPSSGLTLEVVVVVAPGEAGNIGNAVADAAFAGRGSGQGGEYTLEDWSALVEGTQDACAADFEATCGAQEDFGGGAPPPHEHGGEERMHEHTGAPPPHEHGDGHTHPPPHHEERRRHRKLSGSRGDHQGPPGGHHGGPPPTYDEAKHQDSGGSSSSDSSDSSDQEETPSSAPGWQKMHDGGHHDGGHHNGKQTPPPPPTHSAAGGGNCGGPLGFGSREADMCLKEHRTALSAGCNLAIAQTQAAFRELKSRGEEPLPPGHNSPPPHGAGGGLLFFVFAVCVCACCLHKTRRAKKVKAMNMKPVLAALSNPANASLKASLEDAAGVALPSGPGWKKRVFAALEANPELKAAVNAAAAAESSSSCTLRTGSKEYCDVEAATATTTATRSTQQGDTPMHPGAVFAGRVMKCWAVVMLLLFVAFFANLACRHNGGGPGGPDDAPHEDEGAEGEDSEGAYQDSPPPPPPPSPVEGFLFSVVAGFLIMALCSAIYHVATQCAHAWCGWFGGAGAGAASEGAAVAYYDDEGGRRLVSWDVEKGANLPRSSWGRLHNEDLDASKATQCCNGAVKLAPLASTSSVTAATAVVLVVQSAPVVVAASPPFSLAAAMTEYDSDSDDSMPGLERSAETANDSDSDDSMPGLVPYYPLSQNAFNEIKF